MSIEKTNLFSFFCSNICKSLTSQSPRRANCPGDHFWGHFPRRGAKKISPQGLTENVFVVCTTNNSNSWFVRFRTVNTSPLLVTLCQLLWLRRLFRTLPQFSLLKAILTRIQRTTSLTSSRKRSSSSAPMAQMDLPRSNSSSNNSKQLAPQSTITRVATMRPISKHRISEQVNLSSITFKRKKSCPFLNLICPEPLRSHSLIPQDRCNLARSHLRTRKATKCQQRTTTRMLVTARFRPKTMITKKKFLRINICPQNARSEDQLPFKIFEIDS